MRNNTSRLSDRKRRKRRWMLLILLSAMSLLSAFMLRVWLSSKAVELAYEIGRLAAERKMLEEENCKLELEIAELRSPERISRIAVNELKMVRSSNAEVIVLER